MRHVITCVCVCEYTRHVCYTCDQTFRWIDFWGSQRSARCWPSCAKLCHTPWGSLPVIRIDTEDHVWTRKPVHVGRLQAPTGYKSKKSGCSFHQENLHLWDICAETITHWWSRIIDVTDLDWGERRVGLTLGVISLQILFCLKKWWSYHSMKFAHEWCLFLKADHMGMNQGQANSKLCICRDGHQD